MNEQYHKIADYFLDLCNEHKEKSREVPIFMHHRIDGDCLGSAVALATALKLLSWKPVVVLADPIPDNLKFMGIDESLCRLYSASDFSSSPDSLPVAVAVDCSDAGRMSLPGEWFSQAEKKIIIDHHVTGGSSEGWKLVDVRASSTAEMIYNILKRFQDKTGLSFFDTKTANLLMVGIQSDTGRFSYQNTTPEAFRCAADLMEHGANVYINGFHLFEETDSSTLKLTYEALANAQFFADGKIVMTVVTRSMLLTYDVPEESVDGLVSTLRGVRGVLVSIVIRETKKGDLRVNVRSNEPFAASDFAEQFGGGGHLRSAGFTVMDSTVETVSEQIVDRAVAYIQELSFTTQNQNQNQNQQSGKKHHE